MRISRNWLGDFVDLRDLSPEAFSELVTTKIAEVDELVATEIPLANAVVAEIVNLAPHPDRPNLAVVTLTLGGAGATVISGAPNLRLGLRTVYLAPGSTVYHGSALVPVAVREFGGIMSNGVIVSEAELGLTADHSGVMELNGYKDATPGTPITRLIDGPDQVLVIDNKSLTHRPDLWSHFGFARELAAILERPLRLNPDRFSDDAEEGAELLRKLGSGSGSFTVAVATGSGCRRFLGLEIRGVSIKPSPLWLRRRLFAMEIGSKNTIVDLSNYVMLDVGQPNHTYDADKLKGNVLTARKARAGERFVGLDGVERGLEEADVVIADAEGPVALAGIIGGADSAISEQTSHLLLESANFDPVAVRRSSKRHQTRTDASNRFEKTPSPYGAVVGLQRFVQLLRELDPGAVVAGPVSDAFAEMPTPVVIDTSCQYIRARLGADLDDAALLKLLRGLGFMVHAPGNDHIAVTVPYYRASKDVTEPQDLVEEVGRIYGYERIPETVPLIASRVTGRDALRETEHRFRDLLAGCGFSESYGYSTTSPEWEEQLGFSTATAVRLENPVVTEENVLRSSLIPGMVATVAHNARHEREIALFEVGRVYKANPSNDPAARRAMPCHEDRRVVLAFMTDKPDEQLARELSPSLKSGGGFYMMTSVVRRLARAVSPAAVSFVPFNALGGRKARSVLGENYVSAQRWMHPFRSTAVVLGSEVVGVVAELRPGLLTDLHDRVVLAELSLTAVLGNSGLLEQFAQLPKYPDSLFELSVVMKEREPYINLQQTLEGAVDRERLRRVELVAVYQGRPLAEDEKSVSVRLHFGSDQGTLSGAELKSLQERVMGAVAAKSYGIRSR